MTMTVVEVMVKIEAEVEIDVEAAGKTVSAIGKVTFNVIYNNSVTMTMDVTITSDMTVGL